MPTWNRNISMRALRAFCAAAKQQSFRAAAEDLYLTASAVSHQIKHLEEELGKKLFARTSRALTLTESGQAFYDDLYPILQALDATTRQHSSLPERGSLRISVKPFFASEVLLPRLPGFSERYPGLDINVDTSDESSEVADVSIRIFQTPPPSLLCDRLFSIRLIPVAAPEFYDTIKVVGNRITSEFPIIVHDARPNAWRQWQRSARIRLPSTLTTLRLDSMTAVARAAERGLGAALIPRHLVSGWLESQSLVQIFDHELETNDAYYLACHTQSADNPALTPFREWVLQEFMLDA
jgi:LysR family transcriptional regulator, glycine cleavage system transcriptional activator